ncbi:hypothetical protein BGZ61DRAFT_522631 [Ilyonectria robusta]|uniref:uncharacterized protein n=1 Tax=Ilyonectria robusta TaxID=1079257 RepID=UPI001E8D2D3A|nr:uncharacterized protein BGZ61DRAFT_522631 [Ilyonectria robusta]KAH8665343.1 hypothetical protein BGZ61DRAFT_522631 [Ilyonectria robusta]
MFVYQGKLNWYSYASEETFAIVLPNGPVRVGDSVYLFSQWTKDGQGSQKKNWFDTILVDSITQTQATDVTFYLKGAYYSFEVTTTGSYDGLSVIMKNPSNAVSKPMPLKRIWKSDKVLTGTTRIWTGKFSWMHFAKDEPAIFIVPDGFGEDKPILSLWQYTKDSAGKLKDPSFRDAVQKSVSGIDTDVVKFTYHSYYDISCTWEAKTDKLAVHVKEGGHGEDVGSMIRSAIIERKPHSHDFAPPEVAPKKAEVEVRLPQAQASLPRILTALPFPGGLLETLAHTAAFVDQAGYLAKYAQDRFTTLDANYHTLLHQFEGLKADNTNLYNTKKALTRDRDAAKAEAKQLKANLDKVVAGAKKAEEDHQKQIDKLNDEKYHDQIKDEKDRNTLLRTRGERDTLKKEVSALKQKVSDKDVEIASLNSNIDALEQKIIKQEITIARLNVELGIQKSKNDALFKKNGELIAIQQKLEASEKELQAQLAISNDSAALLQQQLNEANKRIVVLTQQKEEAEERAAAAEEVEENIRKALIRPVKSK